jgi:hypothetical protein
MSEVRLLAGDRGTLATRNTVDRKNDYSVMRHSAPPSNQYEESIAGQPKLLEDRVTCRKDNRTTELLDTMTVTHESLSYSESIGQLICDRLRLGQAQASSQAGGLCGALRLSHE